MSAALIGHFGGTHTRDEVLSPEPARRLAATLDRDASALVAGALLPPLWHWLYFLDQSALAAAGPDGHAVAGGLPPEYGLPRRMFAGGRYRFLAPLYLGQSARRTATYTDVTEKTGKVGRLVFVTQRITIEQGGQICVEEERDLVFRAAGAPIPPVEVRPFADDAGERTQIIVPDPVLLFRFSALTFNSHRIHYDEPYARQVEGYPGLVVHGPLTALLLADFVMQGSTSGRFSFRAEALLFCNQPVQLRHPPSLDAQTADAVRCDGTVAMRCAYDSSPPLLE